ncbi:MAG TPA: VOC family protein [Armatimonadota bacterium]|nr:VOC family protein [Armatimonadota bacterium]
MAMGFTGIDHPAVAAADPESLAVWYCEVLGYTRAFKLDRAGHSPLPVFILRAPDGTLLEVMPEDDTARPERTTWTPGWSHLALRVADFETAAAYLESKGARWSGPEVEATGGGRLRSFLDPDGNMLQIVARD